MSEDLSANGSNGSGKVRSALSVLDHADRFRNLNGVIAGLVFFFAAAVGVWAFFLFTELALWLGSDWLHPLMIVTTAWVVLFLVWAMVLALILSVLDLFGVRDLKSLAAYRLSALELTVQERRRLQRKLAATQLAHRDLFRGVVSQLGERGA